MSDPLVGMQGFETFNLTEIRGQYPPDPDSAARHRAEILVKSETLRVVLVTALTGGILNEHDAPGPITIHVLDGSFALTIDDEQRVVSAHEIAVLAPGVPHAVECVEDGAFLLTIAHMSRIPDTGGSES